jgi:hypothetical protein
MNAPGSRAADPLGEFRARLDGGVGPAAIRTRPGDWQFRDEEAFPPGWPGDLLVALATIRTDPWDDPGGPGNAISALVAQLRDRRALLAAVLFSPGRVLGRLQESRGDSSAGVVDSWMAMYWTAEAAFSAITDPSAGPGGMGGMGGDAVLLRPLAARVRFLVSSEPMRWRAQADGIWWARPQDLQFGGNGVLGRALGDRSWSLVVSRCQQARRNWAGCLDEHQSHPLLSQARSAELEQEVRTLVFRHPGGSSRHGRREPLGLSVRPLAERAPLTAQDAAVIDEVTDRHLLPRFDLASVGALAVFDNSRGWRWARALLGMMVALTAVAAVTCAALLLVRQAVWVAAGCYLLIGLGVLVFFGIRWAAPWMLRLPAASAVGVIALVTFLPAGWLRTPFDGWAAVVVLAGSASGYLAVELRNHGVEGLALLRSLGVAAIGAVHALMVSLLGLVAVAPAFVPKGALLSALWHRPGYGHAGMVLLLSTAWCLAAGVFSQILWDDRPITAPLAHLSWRSGR